MFLKYGIILFFLFKINSNPKEFTRNYDQEGTLISAGWIQNNQKVAYWTFYHPNGTIAKKGHFNNDKKTDYWYFYTQKNELLKEGTFTKNKASDWWIFYSKNKKTKIQFKNGKKNGYSLIYHNNRLQKAELYKSNEKTGEWTSYFSFKRDNPNVKF